MANPPRRPVVAVSLGDPGGIGPEVIVKALAHPELRASASFHIYGCAGPMETAARESGVSPFWGRTIGAPGASGDVTLFESAWSGRPERRPNAEAGDLSFRFVEDAIRAAQRTRGDPLKADAVVTAPINKKAWDLAGHGRWPGHTELFADRFATKRYAMMFDSPRLRVVLATIHTALMRVGAELTSDRVREVIELGAETCTRLGVGHPRIAVCGLNPHAGESGLFGDEEAKVIEPAILTARATGIDATGPHSPDSVFLAAMNGAYDLVVAMYHDQGLIPLKLLARDRAVNLTVGLPVPRTSPDHGTAFDIAGQNKADPGSMKSALELAVRLARPS